MQVTQKEKDRITAASVSLCCQDLRPFEIVSGKGFLNFTQAILNLQHKHKVLLKASDILSHPTTVSRAVSEKASTVREDLRSLLQQAYAGGSVSYTRRIVQKPSPTW